MVDKRIVKNALSAYRDSETESGPSLKDTREGKPLDSSLKRLDSEGNEASDGGKLDKILSHLSSLHEAITSCAARLEAVEGKNSLDDEEEGPSSDGSQEGDPRSLMADSQRRGRRDSDQGN